MVAEFKALWKLSDPQPHAVKGKAPAGGIGGISGAIGTGTAALDLAGDCGFMRGGEASGKPMTILSIPDMSCGHCKAAVETALAGVALAGPVNVDLTTRSVQVAPQAAIPALLAALAEAGYPATVVG